MSFADVFKDKVVLITGGTGFLGRHLVQRILEYQPKSIRVFSRDEVKHHYLQEQLGSGKRVGHLIGDVRDYERLKKAARKADIVIHAAALKRIDMIEYNVEESIKTNIMGTLNVVRACLEEGVKKAVFVSTDKACSPVNSYGACKFVGERIFIESNYNKGDLPTIFTCVRYGNVLSSTGSVIPFFVKKIKNGEKIPLTDARMTRFIMTADQSADLIFTALKNGLGGEVFIPRLRSFKIVDLIDALKKHFGTDNEVINIGIRPGEKIHEILINDAEVPRTFVLDDCYVIKSQIEKYQPELEFHYLQGKKHAGETELSSKDFLVQDDELKAALLTWGVLTQP